jgi:hypothetical protein
MPGWGGRGWLGIWLMCFGLGLALDPHLDKLPFLHYIGIIMIGAGVSMVDALTSWYGSVIQHIEDDDAPNAEPGRKAWAAVICVIVLALSAGRAYLDHRDYVRFHETHGNEVRLN